MRSLIILIPVFLLSLPSKTIHPAIVPTFDILKVSLISILQTIFSSKSGDNIPSIASFISSIALYITDYNLTSSGSDSATFLAFNDGRT
jgi:hypothetical protein